MNFLRMVPAVEESPFQKKIATFTVVTQATRQKIPGVTKD